MGPTQTYTVVRVDKDRYRLDQVSGPGPGPSKDPVAFAMRVRDRLDHPLGWQLKPLFVMQGAKSRIWPSAAEVFASTKLMTLKQAKEAIARADNPTTAGNPSRSRAAGSGSGGRAREREALTQQSR